MNERQKEEPYLILKKMYYYYFYTKFLVKKINVRKIFKFMKKNGCFIFYF